MKTYFLFYCLLLFIFNAGAQTWTGATSTDWNTAGNWSPAGVPAPGSSITFNVASPPFNCVLTTAVTIGQFTMTNGAISFGPAGSMTVNNTFSLSGGTFSLGASGILNANSTFGMSAGIFNAGGGILSIPSNTFTLSGGTFNGGTGTTFIGSNVDLQSPASFIKGTNRLIFNGAGDQNLNATFSTNPHIIKVYKLIVNKPGSILRFNGANTDSVEVEDSIILTNGQLLGSQVLKAEKNMWVQSGFDGSGIPIVFTGPNKSIARLDTTFTSPSGSQVTIQKANTTDTVAFIKPVATDTVRIGNSGDFNGKLTLNRGVLWFPDNPPVVARYRQIIINPGGTLLCTSNYFFNAGDHINNGGIFLHNNGTYVFFEPSIPNNVSLLNPNENFNNLIINHGQQFNITASDTMVVNGNLTLQTGTIIGLANSAFNVKGNFSFGSGMSSNDGQNTNILFSGASDQTVQFGAGVEGGWKGLITLNKPSGQLILLSRVILNAFPPRGFTFIKGIVQATTTNFLFFGSGYAVSGASNASYVDGPVRYKWYDNFDFPIGNDGYYAPARITEASASLDTFTAQYHHQPSPNAGGAKDATLQNISQREWWEVSRVNSPSGPPPYLWLSYDNTRSGGVSNPALLRVTRWNGTQWEDKGNGLVQAPFIRSNGPVAAFSPFTLGSTSQAANPLPVQLISFTAVPKNVYNFLQWTVTSELNVDKYVVERSADGNQFNAVGSVKAVNSIAEINYDFHDTTVASRLFYRLKTIDRDGRFDYSKVVMVNRANQGFAASISPNPGTNRINITVVSEMASPANIMASDISGKVLYKNVLAIHKGLNSYTFDLPILTNGIYFITINTNKGEKQVLRYMMVK